jgi:uncharacterized membrane protein YphA (DoxX/SURF4 family)
MSDRQTTLAWAGLAARVALGLTLVFAGASKRAVPVEEFAVVIDAYAVVSPDAAQSIAALLPWAELLLGFSLLGGFMTPFAGAAAGALFVGFLGALLSTKARGFELPNCGCFGSNIHMSTSVTMAMDAILLACAVLAARYGRRRLSLDNWSSQGYTGRR